MQVWMSHMATPTLNSNTLISILQATIKALLCITHQLQSMCLKCWMLSTVCCVCLFTGGRGSLLHSFIQFWVRFSVQIQIYPSSSQRSATVLQLQIPNFSFIPHKQETNNPWIGPYCALPHYFISGSPSWAGQGHWEGDHPTDHWSPWWGRITSCGSQFTHTALLHWCGMLELVLFGYLLGLPVQCTGLQSIQYYTSFMGDSFTLWQWNDSKSKYSQ